MRAFTTAGAACAAALVLGVPAAASAQPLVQEHYSFQESSTFTDTECGDSITIDHTADGSGVFMLKAGRHGDPTPYYFDNYQLVETLTNVANGQTLTIVHRGLFKDLHVEHVEGTVYRFTAVEAGRPVVVYGPDGERLVFDRGRIFHSFLVDTLGDTDLGNDVFLEFDEPDVAGPHPIFFDEVSFCDALDVLR